MTGIPHVSNHARERAAERIGRHLTRVEWNAVILSIVDRRAALLLREKDGRELWLAPCGPITLRLAWAPDTATIITVLPDDEAAIYRGSAAMKSRPVRASFREPSHFHGGKLRRGRTVWQPDETP